MSTIISRILLSAMLCLGAVGWVAGPVSAQSDGDLQEENRELRTRVRDLERELDDARRRIETLERRLADAQGRPISGSADPQEPVVTIDESVPSASPRALLAALRDDYAATFDDMEIGVTDRDKERVAYMRTLRTWESRVNREFKSPITWHIKLRDMEYMRGRRQTGYAVTAEAVDPVSGAVLGEPFSFALSLQQARKLEPMIEDAGGEIERLDPMVLTAVLTPRVAIDPERLDAGAFGGTNFIGPFAIFAYELDAKSLRPVSELTEEAAPTRAPDSR